jgi:ornithine decarboxylase
MTNRIRQFMADNPDLPTPFVAIDVGAVEDNYNVFRQAMPTAAIHYAIKANPNSAILQRLANVGSNFDCASVAEIKMVLACGVDPARISFGNTIKKERDIAEAFRLGIRLYATDSESDVEKLSRAAPGSDVFCRILTSGEGAEWPLSRKFGCDTSFAPYILSHANLLGLRPRGVSFHVGSQMTNVEAWGPALREAKDVFDACASWGLKLDLVNIGGGFPTRYTRHVPDSLAYGAAIMSAFADVFGDEQPSVIIEPGRGMVGSAGIIKTEVVLVSQKFFDRTDTPWAFLDVGKFGGLAETMDEAIRYKIVSDRDGTADVIGFILAGPTCDSADVLYEKTPYLLPQTLIDGDFLYIEGTGAYTTTYSAVSFNGLEPLAEYIV